MIHGLPETLNAAIAPAKPRRVILQEQGLDAVLLMFLTESQLNHTWFPTTAGRSLGKLGVCQFRNNLKTANCSEDADSIIRIELA